MLSILIDLLIFIVLSTIFCIGFAIIWSFYISDKYWGWRDRLEKKKQEKLQEKIKKQLQK